MTHSCIKGLRPAFLDTPLFRWGRARTEAAPELPAGSPCPGRCRAPCCPLAAAPPAQPAHPAPAGGHGESGPFQTAAVQTDTTDVRAILRNSQQQQLVTGHLTLPSQKRSQVCSRHCRVSLALTPHRYSGSPPKKPVQTWKTLFLTNPELPPQKDFPSTALLCIHHSKSEICSRLRVFWLLFQNFPGPGKGMWHYGSV